MDFVPKTQKAKGIFYGRKYEPGIEGYVDRINTLPVQAAISAKHEEATALLRMYADARRDFFFRPCPMRPRHGFVGSRPCCTHDDVDAMLAETLAADPEAEIVVQPLIYASASAIATSTAVAVGSGNDGATSGRDAVTYPLALSPISSEDRKEIAIGDDEDAYAEFVCDRDGRSWLVQLRGGPKQDNPTAQHFVPRDITVEKVLNAGGNELEWERLMAQHAGSNTVVAYHPGGSMLSHYAVHAVLNGVAILFSGERPKIGSYILEDKRSATLEPYDARRVRLGVIKALASAPNTLQSFNGMNDGLALAAVGLHGATTLRTGTAAELLGGAAATLMLLASAACCGELRHKPTARRRLNMSSDRHQVFRSVFSDYTNSRSVLRAAVKSFASAAWSHGYGGRAWAICAAMAVDLEGALLALVRGGNDVERIIKLSHRLLNAVHNGGALLNKFGSERILDRAATGSRRLAAHAVMFWHSRLYNAVPVDQLIDGAILLMQQTDIKCPAMELWDSASGAFKLAPSGDQQEATTALVQARLCGDGKVKFQVMIRTSKGITDADRRKARRIKNILPQGVGEEFVERFSLIAENSAALTAVANDWNKSARKLVYSHAQGSRILYMPAASAVMVGDEILATYNGVTFSINRNDYRFSVVSEQEG